MSYSIRFYYSALIQIPVRPSTEFNYYGCSNHKDLTFAESSKFCPQCGQPLRKHEGNTDLDFIQEMVDANEGIEDVVSFAVDEGFINICLHDHDADKINFDDGFYTDDAGYEVALPIDFTRLQDMIKTIEAVHSDFLMSLSSHFGEIKIVPAITKTEG